MTTIQLVVPAAALEGMLHMSMLCLRVRKWHVFYLGFDLCTAKVVVLLWLLESCWIVCGEVAARRNALMVIVRPE